MSPITRGHRTTNLVKSEPVVAATVLVPAIVFLASWLGFEVDETTALAIAGIVASIGGLIARQLVTPTAKVRRRRNNRER